MNVCTKLISCGIFAAASGVAVLPPPASAGDSLWSMRRPTSSPLPAVSNARWCRTPIDRYVLARLEASGMDISADADPHTLIRRAYFALSGLPPSREAIHAFLADESPNAFEQLVDRLLASPAFGERWGRHWLDVARYANSTGGGRSMLYGSAWRYRDYVIRSFNIDKLYHEFLIEQLAGDLLRYEDYRAGREQLIATAFLALGPTSYELQDKKQLRMDVIDEQIDTIGRAMLGLSLGCARCHDHKFDPVSTREYYALAGIFHSTQTLIHANVSTWVKRRLPVDRVRQQALDVHEQAVKKLETNRAATTKQLDEIRRQIDAERGDNRGPGETGNDNSDALELLRSLEQEHARLSRELQEARSNGPPSPPEVMAVGEGPEVGDSRVCIRGNAHDRGDIVPRGFIGAAGFANDTIPSEASGRLELAQWIANSANPLTSRMMVNRIWHHLFGAGIVRTVDNFGTRGEVPSHPQLLDYLALRFMEEDWSVKAIVREVMLSRTYQLSSVAWPEAASIDPQNRLLARHRRRRLDAESIYDSILALSGQLDRRMGGNTVRADTKTEYAYRFEYGRRAVYLPVFRNRLPDVLAVFDFPDPNQATGRRAVSTTSTQSLFMLNSPFVREQAEAAARRLLEELPDGNDNDRIERLYKRAIGRPPSPRQLRLAREYLARQNESADERLARWSELCHVVIASVRFRYTE